MSEDFGRVQNYYDEFSQTYESARHEGYHLLIDELEIACIQDYVAGKKVLEAGCGTGLILNVVNLLAEEAIGIDLSPGMLTLARNKGLNVQQASITEIPFENETFDIVYSFKVLAHVKDIKKAVSEMARVTKPGGVLVLEFYNKKSIRYIVKKTKKPTKTSDKFTDEQVYTRYDTLKDIKSYLEPGLKVEKLQGVRIFTPFAFVHKIPLVKSIYTHLERKFRDSKLAKYGGFLVVTIRKEDV
ncbi:MAG: class I SAM-dependent methyltransferase [Cyanobacteriota bacterium]